MSITLRIWLTVACIVLLFTILVMYIIPSQQEKYFINNLNQEVENLAKTVALGTNIALTEQNFEGVEMAIDFAKSDRRLVFVALIDESDEVPEAKLTYPPDFKVNLDLQSSDSLIVKLAPFTSSYMSGEIMVGFNTREIQESMDRIRYVAIVVSIVVFLIGILLGLWLAKTISVPIGSIRNAALKVGEGDLSQQVEHISKDEIGDLSRAFNKMVKDLAKAEEIIRDKNQELSEALDQLGHKNEQLQQEKEKSDELLLNILPEETAEELKEHGHAEPKKYEEVSVMFSDFVSFTTISAGLSPEELVKEIDYCFSQFDLIIEKYGLEKIKTIGDAYMCAGGLPVPSQDHAANCVLAAFEIQDFLKENMNKRSEGNHPYFVARLGIHTGPVVAGIVGSKKFAYDIWGDTVNTASRMESSGEADKVNISRSTYEQIKDDPRFGFEYRGMVQAKGKGEVDMYFVFRK